MYGAETSSGNDIKKGEVGSVSFSISSRCIFNQKFKKYSTSNNIV